MSIKNYILLVITLSFSSIFAGYQLKHPLKERQPEWITTVVKRYDSGFDQVVHFSEVIDGNDVVVKRYVFSETTALLLEEDVTEIERDGIKEIVPHGTSVSFLSRNVVSSVKEYNKGVLDGFCIEYFDDGKEEKVTSYSNGILTGRFVEYFPNHEKKVEGFYVNGKLDGELWTYYSTGKRKSKKPYVNGKLHGEGISWYESGVIEAYTYYKDDLLHDTETKASVIEYSEDGLLRSLQHHCNGRKHGDQIVYFDNGNKQAHQVFVDGLLDGKCQEYGKNGEILGGGEFIKGIPIGIHFRNSESGQSLYKAEYDKNGKLLDYITQYNDKGILIAKFFKEGETYDKEYKTFYDDGSLCESYNFKNGSLHGLVEEFHPNGQQKVRIHYQEGKITGTLETWFDNGQPERKEFYKSGVLDGESFSWNKNGQICSKLFHLNGKNDGIVTGYYDNGMMKSKVEYKDGKFHGECLRYFEDGSLQYFANYDNGLLDGEVVKYYEKGIIFTKEYFTAGVPCGTYLQNYIDGSLCTTYSYKDGLIDGRVIGFYKSKRKAFEKNYVLGKFVGEQRQYFDSEEGNLAVLENYNEHGQRDGEQKIFFSNNEVQSLITYKNDLIHGLKQIKNEDDEILEQATYVDGRVHGELIFKGKNGSYTESNFVNGQREGKCKVYYPIHPKHGKALYLEAVCKNGVIDGEVKKYHMNGTISEEYIMDAGLIVGKASYYDPEGNLAREAMFHAGVLEGELKDFFKDGNIQKIITIKNGLPEGEEISYFNDGKIQHRKEYHEGKLHGSSKSYNENGVLIFEAQYKEGLKHGIFNKYYDDGRAKLFQFYDADKQVERKAFSLSGDDN